MEVVFLLHNTCHSHLVLLHRLGANNRECTLVLGESTNLILVEVEVVDLDFIKVGVLHQLISGMW